MPVWYAQGHLTTCVAACVRMVLADFGEHWTEGQLHALLGRPRLGITLAAAHTRLVQASATASLEADWNLDDVRDALQQHRYPIVGVERHPLGYPPASHAIVVVGLTSRRVQVLDPLEGPQPQQYGVRAFELAWKLSGKEALVIISPPRRTPV
jgi:ABC-type bacteriocin/lantibiotic exporter with double-glycine peptidase domain